MSWPGQPGGTAVQDLPVVTAPFGPPGPWGSWDPWDLYRLNEVFAARPVSRLRPRIEATATGLAHSLPAGPPVDLIETYAFPLAVTVMAELFGVPAEDQAGFRTWCRTLMSAGTRASGEAERTLLAYLTALVDSKRVSPGGDLLSDLVHGSAAGGRIWPGELVRAAFLLLVAGLEPAVSLIGNAVLSVVRDPGRLGRLRSDRALLPGAVSGFLRYEGPGAPLARLEGQVAIGLLLDRFAVITLAARPGELSWRDGTLTRSLSWLPVRLA